MEINEWRVEGNGWRIFDELYLRVFLSGRGEDLRVLGLGKDTPSNPIFNSLNWENLEGIIPLIF